MSGSSGSTAKTGGSGSSSSSYEEEEQQQQHVQQVITGANADPQVLQYFWDLASLQQVIIHHRPFRLPDSCLLLARYGQSTCRRPLHFTHTLIS